MKTLADILMGVLAIQGDFERHQHQLDLLGVACRQVRVAGDLEGLDGLIIPGGESTTMSYFFDTFGLRQPLGEFAAIHPVYGTCAGMIMMARHIEDNQAGVKPLDLIDIDVVRTGYGRQVFSCEEPVVAHLDGRRVELTASFIRAPKIARLGDEVTVLATHADAPVLVRQGHFLASSFHTELTADTLLLRYFLEGLVLPATVLR
ncbi:MAG: pyridoxal 5'-phosphate synthase glutaminase subunit PdxT [bacterium]